MENTERAQLLTEPQAGSSRVSLPAPESNSGISPTCACIFCLSAGVDLFVFAFLGVHLLGNGPGIGAVRFMFCFVFVLMVWGA